MRLVYSVSRIFADADGDTFWKENAVMENNPADRILVFGSGLKGRFRFPAFLLWRPGGLKILVRRGGAGDYRL